MDEKTKLDQPTPPVQDDAAPAAEPVRPQRPPPTKPPVYSKDAADDETVRA